MGLFSSSKSASTTSATDNRTTTAGDQTAPQNIGTRNQQANGEGSVSAGGAVRIDQRDERNFGTSLDNLKAGNNATINVSTSDPALAAAALQIGSDTAKAALLTNLGAVTESLYSVNLAGLSAAETQRAAIEALEASDQRRSEESGKNLSAGYDFGRSALEQNSRIVGAGFDFARETNSEAFETQRAAIEALQASDQRRERATTEAINAGLDLGRQASASAETVTQNALAKLAEQRAPDGANLTKVALWVVGALAAVFGLRLFLLRSRSS
jgi:hypothetical protein